MSGLREAVSSQVIERAIRGRLALRFGATSSSVVMPLTVRETSPDDDGRNWQLDFDPASADEVVIAAAEAANALSRRYLLQAPQRTQ